MTREFTNKILEAIDEGLLDRDTVIMACLKYMSEDEVADMAHANEFFPEEDDGYDDYSEPSDGFRDDVEADADVLASAGYGTDEDYGCFGGDGDY